MLGLFAVLAAAGGAASPFTHTFQGIDHDDGYAYKDLHATGELVSCSDVPGRLQAELQWQASWQVSCACHGGGRREISRSNVQASSLHAAPLSVDGWVSEGAALNSLGEVAE
eukprot:496155-Pelagomonas_calceolata.AAC.1